MNYLAIDPGTTMGWAACMNGKWDYGVNRYPLSPKPKNPPEHGNPIRSGARSMRLAKDLIRALQFYATDLLLVEHNLMPGASAKNAEARGEWTGAIGIALETAAQKTGREIQATDVTSQWWRSRAFIQFPRAPKEMTDDDERREWLKNKSIERVRKLGFTDVDDDNIAEAILMIVAYKASVDPAYSATIGKPSQEVLI